MNIFKLKITFFVITFCFFSVCYADNNKDVTAYPVITKSNYITNDIIIKTKLQTAYSLNPELNKFNINVDVRDGVVYLKGALQNSIQKDLAINIANNLEGVEHVNENIKIDKNTKSGENPSDFAQKAIDSTITAIIKSKLLLNVNVNGFDIKVKTVNNVTTLQGTVSTLNEKSIAGRIAIQTAGVSTVKNQIQVK